MPKRSTAARTGPSRPTADPDVILDVLFEDGLLFLSVRNIGSRPVRRVSISFDRPLIGLGGDREVSALPLFTNVEFLAPGREIRTLLDTSASYFGRQQPDWIKATISYQDAQGRRRHALIEHDLGIYRDIGYTRPTGQ
jgi:hypothetical protein